jgi:hypothetical protein
MGKTASSIFRVPNDYPASAPVASCSLPGGWSPGTANIHYQKHFCKIKMARPPTCHIQQLTTITVPAPFLMDL